MDGKTRLRALSVVALLSASAGCGAGDGDTVSTSDSSRLSTVAATTDQDASQATAASESSNEASDSTGQEETGESLPSDNPATESTDPPPVTEPGDDESTGPTASASDASVDTDAPERCTELSDEDRQTIDRAAPASPAPIDLVDAILPTDEEEAAAMFDALPDELIGGSKEIVSRSPGHLVAAYQPPGLASQYGYQAMNLRTSFVGSVLPEPRADVFVAFWVLSDDDDEVVEAAGHEGDLYWVTFISTASGYGIDGTEELYTIAFGDSCRHWGFTAAAPTPEGRDDLIAAFVAATVTHSS
jgi:hypothetical protein